MGLNFDLPFDVARFCKRWDGWVLNDSFPDDENTLLSDGRGSIIKVSASTPNPYGQFKIRANVIRARLANHGDAAGFVNTFTAKGLPLAGFEIAENGEYSGGWLAGGAGFVQVYLTYSSPETLRARIRQSLEDLPWLPLKGLPYEPQPTLRKLKQKLRSGLAPLEDLRDEILDGLADDEEPYLSVYDLEMLASAGPDFHPMLKMIIDYVLEHPDQFYGDDFFASLPMLLLPHGLDDEALLHKALARAEDRANTTSSLLSLAEAFHDDVARSKIMRRALSAASDWYDLGHIVGQIVKENECDRSLWGDVQSVLNQKLGDEQFGAHSNPVSVFAAAMKRGFVSGDDVLSFAHRCIEERLAAPLRVEQALRFLDVDADEGAYFERLEELRHRAMTEAEAEATATSDDELMELYEYLKNDLEDEQRANEFAERHREVVEAHQSGVAHREAESRELDNICKCAVLVAAGDGEISSKESEEVGKIKTFVRMLRWNREAIFTLQRTSDIEAARKVRAGTVLLHEPVLSEPPFARAVLEDLAGISSPDEVLALLRLYASRVTDEFDRRLALWAAEEVAASDGFEDGEKKLLAVFAAEWEIDLAENRRFFKNVVYPAIDDQFEFTSVDDEGAAGAARELDAVVAEGGEQAEALQTLMEAVGVDSFDELARALPGDEDEAEIIEDTEPPAIFEVLLEKGDWQAVRKAAENGVDVNEVMNLQGLQDLSILILCAEQGDLETLTALIAAGADVNHKIGNIDYAGGFQDPLTASLQGNRMDHFDYLLEMGAHPDPYADSEAGWTPLTMAVQHENVDALKTLLSRGADPNTAQADGANAFKLLGFMDSAAARQCMRLLLAAGIDANRTDGEGFATIHNAACNAAVETMQLIVEEARVPVDFPIKKFRGAHYHTAINRALAWGNGAVAHYLFQQGASLKERAGARPSITAIFSGAAGAIDGQLEEPLEWLQKAIEARAEMTAEDLVALFRIIGESDDASFDGWAAEFLDRLLEAADLSATEIEKLDTDELEQTLEVAVESAPKTTETFLRKLSARGFDLEAVL